MNPLEELKQLRKQRRMDADQIGAQKALIDDLHERLRHANGVAQGNPNCVAGYEHRIAVLEKELAEHNQEDVLRLRRDLKLRDDKIRRLESEAADQRARIERLMQRLVSKAIGVTA